MRSRAWWVIALVALVALPACTPWREAATAVSRDRTIEVVGQFGGATYSVAISGPLAYAGVGPCLVILDISDPAGPVLIGQTGVLARQDQDGRDTPGTFRDLAVTEGYAFAAGLGGLRIFDVSDPAAPKAVSFLNTPGFWTAGVAVAGGYAYVADGEAGLRIIDVSDPAAPTEVGYYDTPGSAQGVALLGSTVYVADDQGGLLILRLAQPPGLPHLEGNPSLRTPGPPQLGAANQPLPPPIRKSGTWRSHFLAQIYQKPLTTGSASIQFILACPTTGGHGGDPTPSAAHSDHDSCACRWHGSAR